MGFPLTLFQISMDQASLLFGKGDSLLPLEDQIVTTILLTLKCASRNASCLSTCLAQDYCPT